jgi:hypothetical protein
MGMAQRTYFISSLGALLLSLLLAACDSGSDSNRVDPSAVPDPMKGSSLYADVVRYFDFGIHRTAHPGDLLTAEWVRDELAAAGLDSALLPWEVNQFFLEEVRFEVAGKAYDAFPAWYPRATGPAPLRAELGLFNPGGGSSGTLRGKVAYIPLWRVRLADLTEGGISEYAAQAASDGAVALAVPIASLGPDSGLVKAGNVRVNRQEPQPIPIVFVAPTDDRELRRAAWTGAEVHLTIDGEDRRGEEAVLAYNVVARIERGPRWVVVTTPTSGWFGCGGERGPGVALFLGLARWVSRQESDLSYLFIANSGHELGYLGAEVSIEEVALPPAGSVVAWLHLGAAIATRAWRKTEDGTGPSTGYNPFSFLQGSPELVPTLRQAFRDVPHLVPGSLLFLGELEVIRESGYTVFGFFGEHYFFHQPEDTAEETMPQLLDPIGRALVEVLLALEPSRSHTGRKTEETSLDSSPATVGTEGVRS